MDYCLLGIKLSLNKFCDSNALIKKLAFKYKRNFIIHIVPNYYHFL